MNSYSDMKMMLDEVQEWRRKVFQRDDYACQECGGKRNLQAHHIKQVIFYPEHIYDVNNGITLCKECHMEIDHDF